MKIILIKEMDSTQLTSDCKLISFNCKGVTRSLGCVKSLCKTADVIALQETWLLQHDIPLLGTIDENFGYYGNTAVDLTSGTLRGRPHGGVALLWRKSRFPCVSILHCKSVRLLAIKVFMSDRAMIIFSVYMPNDERENLVEFTECLGEIYAIIEVEQVDLVYVLGDFNAHPDTSFYKELSCFCDEQ